MSRHLGDVPIRDVWCDALAVSPILVAHVFDEYPQHPDIPAHAQVGHTQLSHAQNCLVLPASKHPLRQMQAFTASMAVGWHGLIKSRRVNRIAGRFIPHWMHRFRQRGNRSRSKAQSDHGSYNAAVDDTLSYTTRIN